MSEDTLIQLVGAVVTSGYSKAMWLYRG